MEKNQFNKVIRQYASSTSDDAKEVLQLKADFPYSQLLHALAARLTKDHGFSNQQQELQQAAVYAADRSVLKEVMTLDLPAISIKKVQAVKSSTTPIQATKEEDLVDEVIHDLERLHELKHNFEAMFVDTEESPGKKKDDSKAVGKKETPANLEDKSQAVKRDVKAEPQATVVRKENKKGKAKASKVKKAKATGSKKAKKAGKAKKLAASKTIKAPKAKSKTLKKQKVKKKHVAAELIDEIATSKAVITPANEKQKEQLAIIDQFIKTQPSIASIKDKLTAAPTGDLSAIKTGEFGDNVISETLAEILISQGKKDKAIEVLKKLIWKYPQKKAYFAAQIEDLRK